MALAFAAPAIGAELLYPENLGVAYYGWYGPRTSNDGEHRQHSGRALSASGRSAGSAGSTKGSFLGRFRVWARAMVRRQDAVGSSKKEGKEQAVSTEGEKEGSEGGSVVSGRCPRRQRSTAGATPCELTKAPGAQSKGKRGEKGSTGVTLSSDGAVRRHRSMGRVAPLDETNAPSSVASQETESKELDPGEAAKAEDKRAAGPVALSEETQDLEVHPGQVTLTGNGASMGVTGAGKVPCEVTQAGKDAGQEAGNIAPERVATIGDPEQGLEEWAGTQVHGNRECQEVLLALDPSTEDRGTFSQVEDQGSPSLGKAEGSVSYKNEWTLEAEASKDAVQTRDFSFQVAENFREDEDLDGAVRPSHILSSPPIPAAWVAWEAAASSSSSNGSFTPESTVPEVGEGPRSGGAEKQTEGKTEASSVASGQRHSPTVAAKGQRSHAGSVAARAAEKCKKALRKAWQCSQEAMGRPELWLMFYPLSYRAPVSSARQW